jgi:hypothetical protein
MHPFIIESIAAGRVRESRQAAARHRDAGLARSRRLRHSQATRTPGTTRQPRAAWFRLHI